MDFGLNQQAVELMKVFFKQANPVVFKITFFFFVPECHDLIKSVFQCGNKY